MDKLKITDEYMDLIKKDIKLLGMSMEEALSKIENETGYEKKILEAVKAKDTERILGLVKKVDELIVGGRGDLGHFYPNSIIKNKLKTLIQDFIDGISDKAHIYLSDAGHGRLLITYDDNCNLAVVVGNQSTPGVKYLWDRIK